MILLRRYLIYFFIIILIAVSFTYISAKLFPRFAYIENDITFNFNVNFDQSRTLVSSFIVDSEEDFNEQANSSNISIKPEITYKFSRWVNGTIFYSYGISENKTTGKKKEQDFGFVINIKITG